VNVDVIHLATGNAGKAREFERLLGRAVRPIVDYEPPPEDGATFEENALHKARAARRRVATGWVLADDSGLQVDALDGAPGVHSARYGGEGLDDTARCALLLEALQDAGERTARFVCAIAAIDEDGREYVVEGRLEGAIARHPHGDHGFGYDPIFIPLGLERTCAMLHPEEKDAISHRGAAVRRLLEVVETWRG
jgi:XTP/dITP diphosphohydrolase